MFGKDPRLNPLALRKKLLLAESELNRAQLAADAAALRAGARALADRAKSVTSIASSAGMLITGLAAFRRVPPSGVNTKQHWWQIALKGAGLVSTLWLASRRPARDRDQI
jgi:hypothetical protein